MAMNKTSSSGMTQSMQTYYDRKLIVEMQPKLVHYEYGQRRVLPKNQGKTVNFRKWTPFEAAVTALTEGVVPDGQNLSLTHITCDVCQYGGYVSVSDVLDMTALDPVVNDAVELMADQGALTLDTLVRDALHTGTVVSYAGKEVSGVITPATARNQLSAAHKLTTTDIRKAARLLKKNRAPKFDRGGKGYYVAIVGPDAVYDLQSDPLWQDVAKYQDSEAIYAGEIGRMFGVIVVEAHNTKVFAGEGVSGADVASTLVFGRDAYGVVELENGNMRAIVKAAGSAGTADPLEQVSTVGWKSDGFAAKILQNGWLVRVEHGFSA